MKIWSTVSEELAERDPAGAGLGAPNWSHYWDNVCNGVAHFYCVQQ